MSLVFKTPKTTLNTTTKAIQNLGGDCPPCPEPVVESTSEEFIRNGEYTLTPKEGVDGFSQVDITVNIPSDVNNQDKTVSPSTSSQTVEADSGYSGLGTVTVNAVTSSIDNNISAGNIKKDVTILGVTGNYDPQPNLSNLNITPSTNAQEYNPAISGVDGYNLVSVAAVTAAIDSNIQSANILSGVTILGVAGSDEGYAAGYAAGETDGEAVGYAAGEAAGEIAGAAAQKALLTSTTITQNGTTTREDGWNSVTVNVQPNLINTATFTSNGTYSPQGYDGYREVQVSVQPQLQAKTVSPTTSQQVVSTDLGYDGLSAVTVNAVTNAIDQNITAGNIKDGVTILGVTGNVIEADFEPNKQFSGGLAGTYMVEPQSGYNGFDEVQVTVESNPTGSFWNSINTGDDTLLSDLYIKLNKGGFFDSGELYFDMQVDSGSIDSETGYYVAEDAAGSIFYIQPYLENPDYDSEQEVDPIDNPQFIFPKNFDLTDLAIQVEATDVQNNVTVNKDETDPRNQVYTVEISECTLAGINLNGDQDSWPMYWDGAVSGGLAASTRSLSLSTNEVNQISIASPEEWEIELDQPQAEPQMNVSPLTKSGLRSPAPQSTLEVSQMQGDAGVYTLNVFSPEDQSTGFTLRGVESGNELHIDVESLGDYFTIESFEDDNDVSVVFVSDQSTAEHNVDLSYSLDDGENWSKIVWDNEYGNARATITLNAGKYVFFKGDNDRLGIITDKEGRTGRIRFESTETVNIGGNVCSMLDSKNFTNYALAAPYAFRGLFQFANGSGLKVTDASSLTLPSSLSANCFERMFENNTYLTDAPQLPATNVPSYAYYHMFDGCTSLVEAPALPAKILGENCYNSMFSGCTTIEYAPLLPAIYLEKSCYAYMFFGCTSLASLEEGSSYGRLGVAESCCDYMFSGCSALEEVPSDLLPAERVTQYSYRGMFKDCSALMNCPDLPATGLQLGSAAYGAYWAMFQNCTSITESPELPATTLVTNVYKEMFSGCTSLEAVTCYAEDISAANCTTNWLYNVAQRGEISVVSTTNWTSDSPDGTPVDWTVTYLDM